MRNRALVSAAALAAAIVAMPSLAQPLPPPPPPPQMPQMPMPGMQMPPVDGPRWQGAPDAPASYAQGAPGQAGYGLPNPAAWLAECERRIDGGGYRSREDRRRYAHDYCQSLWQQGTQGYQGYGYMTYAVPMMMVPVTTTTTGGNCQDAEHVEYVTTYETIPGRVIRRRVIAPPVYRQRYVAPPRRPAGKLIRIK